MAALKFFGEAYAGGNGDALTPSKRDSQEGGSQFGGPGSAADEPLEPGKGAGAPGSARDGEDKHAGDESATEAPDGEAVAEMVDVNEVD